MSSTGDGGRAVGQRRELRALLAVAVVVAGTFASVELAARTGGGLVPRAAVQLGALLAVGGLAGLCAVHPSPVAPQPRPRWRWLAAGALAGPVCFGINLAYATVVFGEGTGSQFDPSVPPWLAVVTLALGPALVEEWLFRGVLWRVLRSATGPGWTLLLSATTFGLLHAQGSAGLAEIPHRVVMGLVFGWLRLASGRVAPATLAHFGNNALAALH